MRPKFSWQFVLLGRVVLNAMAGALLAALAGMLCGGIAGAMIDWLDNAANVARRISPPSFIDPHLMAFSLAGFGAGWGFIVGALIFIIAAARAKPGRILEPLRALIGRVALGQIAGTLGVCSLFLGVEIVRAAPSGKSFSIIALSDVVWLISGVAVLMICGAIAGAFSKRGTR